MRLKRRVAVVTGGGSGIGEAISVRLAEEGARVAVLDINEDAARLTAELAGGLAVHADVSDGETVDRALDRVEQEVGPVDVWVNNAGITGGHDELVNPRAEKQMEEAARHGKITTPLESLVRLTDREWREMVSVHLDGTFHGTRAAARSMARRGRGAIVNIASICGIDGCAGSPHYSAAKAGILGFTRSVAKELIVQGVRVNAVAPGFVETPMLGSLSEPLIAATVLETPARRLGQPREIAATVAFLVNDDASFYVGATLSPNGGFVTV